LERSETSFLAMRRSAFQRVSSGVNWGEGEGEGLGLGFGCVIPLYLLTYYSLTHAVTHALTFQQ
jgi:hypothetical protein